MSMQTLEPSKVKRRGIEALTRELGAAGMVQFMQQFSSGSGDYTRERRKAISRLTVDEVWTEMKTESK